VSLITSFAGVAGLRLDMVEFVFKTWKMRGKMTGLGWLEAPRRLLFAGDVIPNENTWPPEIKILAMTFNPQ
jgi:hypothetical protein